MEQIKNKFLYVILAIIVLCAILCVVYIGHKYVTDDSKTNLEAENQVSFENETIGENTNDKKIEVVKKQDKAITVDNTIVEAPETTDVHKVRKYIDDGLIKYETPGFTPKYSEYKLRYNYNYFEYDLEVILPSTWGTGFYTITPDVQVVRATENVEGKQPMSAIIYEIEVESGMSYDDAINLLANKINEFVLNQGSIYEIVNWKFEDIEVDGEIFKVLAYQHNAGKYYQTKCYSIIKLRDSYMYILTIAIPTGDDNDENMELKNKILKSYKFIEN